MLKENDWEKFQSCFCLLFGKCEKIKKLLFFACLLHES